MSDPRPPFTLREIRRDIRGHLSALLVIATLAAVSLVLGLSGPFDTLGAMRFGPRLAYWTAIVFGTYATGTAVTVALSRATGRHAARPWVRCGLQVAATGLAVGLLLTALQALAFGQVPGDPTGWARLFGTAWMVSALVIGLGTLAEARQGAEVSGPVTPELMDRLPVERRGRLLALSVQPLRRGAHHRRACAGPDAACRCHASRRSAATRLQALGHWVAGDLPAPGQRRRGDPAA